MSINLAAGGATAGNKMDNQSAGGGSAGIHNTAGALGGSAFKWGPGVFRGIQGNDLHYEASEHFKRVPERVVATGGGGSVKMRRDAT